MQGKERLFPFSSLPLSLHCLFLIHWGIINQHEGHLFNGLSKTTTAQEDTNFPSLAKRHLAPCNCLFSFGALRQPLTFLDCRCWCQLYLQDSVFLTQTKVGTILPCHFFCLAFLSAMLCTVLFFFLPPLCCCHEMTEHPTHAGLWCSLGLAYIIIGLICTPVGLSWRGWYFILL